MRTAPAAATVAAWIVALTVAVDPWGWYPFGPVKWAVASAGVLALAAGTLRAPSMTVVPRVQWPMALLVVVFAVAAARGVDPLYAWTGTPERHFGVLTWGLVVLAFGVGLNLQRPAAVLWGTSLAGVLVGGAATLEALGWEPRVFDVDRRLSATSGSPAYLGAAVALLLPVCVACALDRSRPVAARAVAALAVPLLVVAALGSGARAAWVGLAAAALMTTVRRRHRLRRVVGSRSVAEVAVAAAVALAIGATVVVLSPVGPRIAATFDRDEAGGSSRLDEWRVATRVAGAHLGLGVGPEGYRIAFAEGVDAAYERAHGRTPAPDRAHAAPLDVLVTGGVAALALWLVVMASLVRHLWRALADDRVWLGGLAAAVLAYFTAQLLLFPLAELDPVAWLLAGVVVLATAQPRERRTWWPWRGAVAAPALLAAVALLAGATDIVADHHARDAVAARERGDHEAALRDAARAAERRPDTVRLHLLEAQLSIEAGRSTVEALRAVDAAHDVSPRDPIVRKRMLTLLVERAEATSVPAHAADARAQVDRAVQDDPYDAELRVLQGRAAWLDGDDVDAERAWTTAEDLAPRSPVPAADLALLYLRQGRLDAAIDAIGRAAAIDPDDDLVVAVRARVDAAR